MFDAARSLSRRVLVVAAVTFGGAALTAACHLCGEPDPDCHGDIDPDTCGCAEHSYGGSSDPPTYSAMPGQCSFNAECPARQSCGAGGQCRPDPTVCASDDDCPAGATCDYYRKCRCNADVACGDGLTCTPYGICEVCIADAGVYGDHCRAVDGGDVAVDAAFVDATSDAQGDAAPDR